MTRYSLPSIPSTEITNGRNPLVMTVITVLVFLDLFPSSQERCHWFILVHIYISVSKFDINDGVNFAIP